MSDHDINNEEGVYIEYPTPEGGVRRVPTTLPITMPLDIDPRGDFNAVVLVITHGYLERCGMTLSELDGHPLVRMRYVGCGREVEPGLLNAANIRTWNYIEFSGVENVRRIPDMFMKNCTLLISIDLSPFRNVTDVGNCFLYGGRFIHTLDLSSFRNVTKVGSQFLFDCTFLSSIDLSPLSNVTTVGMYFLAHCTSLTTIDLSPLVSLTTTLDKTFMIKCKALKPAMRKQFMQSVEDRKNGVAPSTPVAARKVGVKAGVKKKK